MARCLNKVMLIGYVGKVEDRVGNQPFRFSLATSEDWRDKSTGERRSHTDWHNIVIFNEKLIEVGEKYIEKGKHLWVEGSIKNRSWEHQGKKYYATDIVISAFNGGIQFLDKASGSGGYRGAQSAADYGYDGDAPPPGYSSSHDTKPQGEVTTRFDEHDGDEIPF